jgi:hypothetical protein
MSQTTNNPEMPARPSSPSLKQNPTSLPKLGQASASTPSPTRVLKRKAATDKDIFKPNKRPAYSGNQQNFSQEYQKDQRKVQDELPMRQDVLKGIVVPPRILPRGINSKNGGKTQQGDMTKVYQYVAERGNSARVRANKHISQAQRERAFASFPMAEARKEEERQAKRMKHVPFLKDIHCQIENARKKVDRLRRNKADFESEEGRWTRFMLRCYKELNHAARFKAGPLEHQNGTKYHQAFVSPFEFDHLAECFC